MEDGMMQEVRLHYAPNTQFFLQFTCDEDSRTLPVSPGQLRNIFDLQYVEIPAPGCRCLVSPSGDMLTFVVEGVATVQFAMAVKHFELLVKSLSMPVQVT